MKCPALAGPCQAEERLQPREFRLELALERAFGRRPPIDVADLRLQLAVLHREVAPADHAIAPQQWQGVVAAYALGGGRIGFEPVDPTPQHLEPPAVVDDRIEWREQPHRARE